MQTADRVTDLAYQANCEAPVTDAASNCVSGGVSGWIRSGIDAREAQFPAPRESTKLPIRLDPPPIPTTEKGADAFARRARNLRRAWEDADETEQWWRTLRRDRERDAAPAAFDAAQVPFPYEPGQLTFDGGVETPRRELVAAPVPTSPDTCTADLWLRQEQLALALEDVGLHKRAIRARDCNKAWNTFDCVACGERTFRCASKCDLRTCVSCQRRHSTKLAAKVRKRIETVKRGRPPPGYRLRLITLTVRTAGVDGMPDALKVLKHALPRIWRQLLSSRRKGKGKERAGMLAAIEAGELRGNIHVHCLYWGPFVVQRELSRRWSELTGGSMVVDVREAKGDKAIAEICKYVCSPALDVAIQARLEKALIGSRRVRTYGIFYGCDPEDADFEPECPHCHQTQCLIFSGTTRFVEAAWSTGPPSS